jgi:hypothetical protein
MLASTLPEKVPRLFRRIERDERLAQHLTPKAKLLIGWKILGGPEWHHGTPSVKSLTKSQSRQGL